MRLERARVTAALYNGMHGEAKRRKVGGGCQMESPDVMNSIVEFGTDAVLRYRKISQEPDNEVPEYFLGSFIALGLYERFQCGVHLEHLYTDVATSVGVPRSSELTNKIGGQRADVALYKDGFPIAIIELKLLDERHPLVNIEADALKVRKLGEMCKVPGYIGVLICETTAPLEEQAQRLETALQRKVHRGATQSSRDGKWRWCFGCSLVSDNLRPETARPSCCSVT
jgi:hypothetical protein